MKVAISGCEQTGSFLDEVKSRGRIIAAQPESRIRAGSLDIDALGGGQDERTSDRMFAAMVRERSQIDTLPFRMPRKSGFMGALMGGVRAFLWKLLRYQHDRMSTRQNRVNAWLISSLELQVQSLQSDVGRLSRELEQTRRDLDVARNARSQGGPQ